MTSALYLEAIELAYQGEVYGEALYKMIADAQPEAEHAWKWRVMVQVEHETKHLMRRLVARRGGDTAEQKASRDQAETDFVRYRALPWRDLMQVFSAELVPAIAEYAELEYDAPPRDRWVLQRLTDHEVVSKRFCDLEVAGRDRKSVV